MLETHRPPAFAHQPPVQEVEGLEQGEIRGEPFQPVVLEGAGTVRVRLAPDPQGEREGTRHGFLRRGQLGTDS